MSEFPVEADLLDVRILNLLVVRASKAEGNGYRWFGLSVGQTMRALGMEATRGNVCAVRRAYNSLKLGGRAYRTHGSKRVKWFPSTKEVMRHAIDQTGLEDYL